MKLHTPLCLLLVACSGTGDDGGQLPATDAPGPLVDAAVDAPPEPMPAFRVQGLGGRMAIDENGVRADFRLDGVPGTSSLSVYLYIPDDGVSDMCEVTMPPTFLGFTYRSPTGRQFRVVQLDLGAGPIVHDGCGWDDAFILERLATMSPAEVGWQRARFEEDRPYLDVFQGGEWLREDIAWWVFPGSVRGYTMAADGNASTSNLAQPEPGTIVPGVYDY